jgi:hypothetical protein
MSALVDNALTAVFRDGQMIITLASGSEIRFPVAENPRLAPGSETQLNRVEISPYGIHWPELDEDLSFEGFLKGDYGQHQVPPGMAQPMERRKRAGRFYDIGYQKKSVPYADCV